MIFGTRDLTFVLQESPILQMGRVNLFKLTLGGLAKVAGRVDTIT